VPVDLQQSISECANLNRRNVVFLSEALYVVLFSLLVDRSHFVERRWLASALGMNGMHDLWWPIRSGRTGAKA
jgi:hypothetical protein